jgi:peptide/nickel transport system substrate-binding protein
VLVVGLGGGEPDFLDPTLSRNISAGEVERTFCEKLYDYNNKLQIVPQLAAALPVISKDKLTYTIPLRKGIQFNDGTPFNAQAVVAAIQRDLSLPGSSRASDFSAVDSITASGPYTAVIHLKAPFTPLTATLASLDGPIVSPAQVAKLGANFTQDPICVGPFMYDGRVAGDSVTVIKSPDYYNKGAVHLDKIVFKVENDGAAAAAALKAGDLQALDGVSTTELPGLMATSSVRVFGHKSLGWQGVFVNVGNKNGVGNLPYGGVGTPLGLSAFLRKAFEEAIDRTTLDKVVFDGTVDPGCTPVSPETPLFDPSLHCTPYNPTDAKRLVLASNVPNPTVHLMARNTTDNLRLAQFIQAQEAAVGINVVIDATDATTVTARSLSGNFDAYLNSFVGCCDNFGNVDQFVATSGARDYSGYSNPRLDLILANVQKATTAKALKTLYRAADQILLNDRPIVFLDHPIRYAAASTSVTGVQFYPDTLLRVAFAQFK